MFVFIVAMILLCASMSYAGAAGKEGVDTEKKAKPVTEAKEEVVPEKVKPSVTPKPTKQENPTAYPQHAVPQGVASPVGLPDVQGPFAPAADDKGRQIKWHLLSSGSVIGGSSSKFQLRRTPGDRLGGTVGQLGVGSGSSETFGTDGGFWQAPGGMRGDVNGDGAINVGDVIHLVNFLYRDGPPPVPAWAGDFDCDGKTNVGDVVQLVNYMYRDGPPPSC
jgi:hypothetical protein